jgi:hypothetical protein
MELKNVKISNLKKRLNDLKTIANCPKYYLLSKFKECLTEIDLRVEQMIFLKENPNIDSNVINENRKKLVTIIDEFEKECMKNCDTKNTINNLNRSIELIEELKIRVEKLDEDDEQIEQDILQNELEEIENLINFETYKVKKIIFKNKNIIFLNNELCEKSIYNTNNYDDIYDEQKNEKDIVDINFFGVLIILVNGYFSKNKFM